MGNRAEELIAQLEAGIAQRDARIVELEAIVPIESNLRAKAERVAAELDRELAALKAQKPISDMEIEAEGWWNDDHNVYTWPITVGEWGARIECHGRTPAEAQQLALSVVKAQPSAGVVLPERELFEEWADDQGFCLDCKFFEEGNNFESADTRMAFDIWMARARLNQPTAGDGVLCALMSALEGVVHDQRVPNEVSQECAAVLIEARRLNHCRAQAVPDGIHDQHRKAMKLLREVRNWIIPKGNISMSIIERVGAFLDSAAPSANKESGDE